MEHIKLEITTRAYRMLESLNKTGLYGETINDTATRLLEQKLSDILIESRKEKHS